MTLTGVESVRPSSDGSVFASSPLGDLAPTYVESAVSDVPVAWIRAALPPLAPDATPMTAKLRIATSRGSARRNGERLRRHAGWFPLDKVLAPLPSPSSPRTASCRPGPR